LVASFFAGRLVDARDVTAPVAKEEPRAEANLPSRGARPTLFQPVVAVDGSPAYSTHEILPEFVLHALVAAGHRVWQTEHKLRLDAPDGMAIDLPVIETQVVDMRPQTL
jgi:hypothetical protein